MLLYTKDTVLTVLTASFHVCCKHTYMVLLPVLAEAFCGWSGGIRLNASKYRITDKNIDYLETQCALHDCIQQAKQCQNARQ